MHILAITMARHSQFTPILNELASRHDVTLLAPPSPGPALKYQWVPLELPAMATGPKAQATRDNFQAMADAVMKAARPLSRRRFDVVFGQVSWGALGSIGRLLDAAVVAHMELPSMEMKKARWEFPLDEENRRADDVRRELVHGILRRVHSTIVPSAYARSLLPMDLQAKTRVVMEGFEVGPLLAPAQRRKQRHRFALPLDAPIVGFFGRTIEAVRGFDIFLAVGKRVRSRFPDARLLVVGEPITVYGNERAYLGEESFFSYALRQAGMVEADLVFFRLQPPATFRALVSSTDVAVFPIFENAGNWSFFETLALGVPVVAARGCFFPEVVVDGENGYLCDVRDVEEIAGRCIQVLSDSTLAARLGQASWSLMRAGYTVDAAARGYETVLSEAAHGG